MKRILWMLTSLSLLGTGAHLRAQEPAAEPPVPPVAAPQTELQRRVAANLKLLALMERYAEALANAKDEATAAGAEKEIGVLTTEVKVAGAELLKEGKPDAAMMQEIAANPEVSAAGKRVAKKTKSAAVLLSYHPAVARQLGPSIAAWTAAMKGLQTEAETPKPDPAVPPAAAEPK